MTEKESYLKSVIWDPKAIENTSMAQIDKYLDGMTFDHGQRAVVKRIVHTTGDPSLASMVKFHPQAISAGLEALRSGVRVFTDVNMVRAGINLKKLRKYGGTVYCAVHRPEVAVVASAQGITRSAAAFRLYGNKLDKQLVVVGNAPTALFEVLRLMQQGIASPAMIIGIPVGFVGAVESKELLTKFDIPYITLPGTRGGSPLAAAVVNGLLNHMED